MQFTINTTSQFNCSAFAFLLWYMNVTILTEMKHALVICSGLLIYLRVTSAGMGFLHNYLGLFLLRVFAF